MIPTTDAGKPETLFDDQQRYNEVLEVARQRAVALGVYLDAPRPYPSPPTATPTVTAAQRTSPLPDAQGRPTPCKQRLDCRLPTQQLFINYEGRVMPCCHPHANVKMKAGDLRVEDFDTIWNNATYRALRGSLRDGDLHPICRTCSIAQDPPPAPEDPELLRSAPTLEEWAADRPVTDDSKKELPLIDLLRRAGVLDYLQTVESEREGLTRHTANLETERPHLLQHITNLEAERAALRDHVANLETLRSEQAAARLTPPPRAHWLASLRRGRGPA